MKLALIGKNISHSKSPEMYKKILSDVDYSLLDYQHESEIPSLLTLFEKFEGISITSPYKQSFNKQVELVGVAKELQAINCVRLKNNKLQGTNTDYSAIVDILKELNNKYGNLDVVILGDGVMANVTGLALRGLKISYRQFSRKLTDGFSMLKKIENLNVGRLLIINCCARDYISNIELKSSDIFWDFNYNFKAHQEKYTSKCTYLDGLDMLFRQAVYAVTFWSS